MSSLLFSFFLTWTAFLALGFCQEDPFCIKNQCLVPNTALDIVVPSGLYFQNTLCTYGPLIGVYGVDLEKYEPMQAVMALDARYGVFYCDNMNNVIRASTIWFEDTDIPITSVLRVPESSDINRLPNFGLLTENSDDLIKAHVDMGMLNLGYPQRVCRPGPKDWIERRHTPCSFLSASDKSLIVSYPLGMSENYDISADTDGITIITKGGTVTSAIRAKCIDVHGNEYLLKGNKLRMSSGDAVACLITGARLTLREHFVTPYNYNIENQCMSRAKVDILLDNWYSPSFLLGIGPHDKRAALEAICGGNYNAKFFRDNVDAQCYAT